MKVYAKTVTNFGEWCAEQGMPLSSLEPSLEFMENGPEVLRFHGDDNDTAVSGHALKRRAVDAIPADHLLARRGISLNHGDSSR